MRRKTAKQKWVEEGGVFFPISGNATLYETPGDGVFQVYEQTSMGGSRIGLRKIADEFTFGFKIYDLGIEGIMDKIKMKWNKDGRTKKDEIKNLGVIFNGLKGTGKTIASKLVANQLDIPTVIVGGPCNGLVEFMQSLCFECIVLVDEAEKTFSENGEMLLRMIDGVYNETRKLYILTTNSLSIDPNLIDRPGRIRYIKKFGNLTEKAIADYVKDNLEDPSKISEVMRIVDLLDFSTIDILTAVVDEVNTFGEVGDDSELNIPRANYRFDVISFYNLPKERFGELKNFIKTKVTESGGTFSSWWNSDWIDPNNPEEKDLTGEDCVMRTFRECGCYDNVVTSRYSYLIKGQETRIGSVLEEPDEAGFFVVKNFDDAEMLCLITSYYDAPSLYRGGLNLVF